MEKYQMLPQVQIQALHFGLAIPTIMLKTSIYTRPPALTAPATSREYGAIRDIPPMWFSHYFVHSTY